MDRDYQFTDISGGNIVTPNLTESEVWALAQDAENNARKYKVEKKMLVALLVVNA